MEQHNNGASTLPRGFRYHHSEDQPSTPEPSTNNDSEPQPPRLPRFKVKRRNVSNSFNAPTSQFLASVAAADTPIPTIEIPQDCEMIDQVLMPMADGYLSPQLYFRSGSPPKTPVPTFADSDQGSQFPDWSRYTPEPPGGYTGRPLSSRSENSDCSDDDSFYSGGRLSRPSNDDSTCTSPEADLPDPFHFGSISKGKEVDFAEPVITLNGGSTNLIRDTRVLNRSIRNKSRNDAPWSKPQSDHLWATYQLYLGDPTQTPFRLGVSNLPPDGVINRVSRQAKRSWKGPKPSAPVNIFGDSLEPSRAGKSGSNTPTLYSSSQYGAWPHSKIATRNHFKELCKRNTSRSVQCSRHHQIRSPTPFDRSQRNRTPESRGAFSTQDICVSLVTSTSTTMQPDGPLAKLALETSPITPVGSSFEIQPRKPLASRFGYDDMPPRLGSPFVSQTYGPSSTNMGTRPAILRSPIAFPEPRSLHNTQKRRAAHDLDAELSPNGAVLRPGVQNEPFFGAPINSRRVRNRGFSLGDEAFRQNTSNILYNPVSDFSRPKMPLNMSTTPSLMPSVSIDDRLATSLHQRFGSPPRLGSPLSFEQNNNTFPRRHVLNADAPRTNARPFATMHQSRRSIDSINFGPNLSSQRTQQAQVKLKEIQEREEALRHQNSQ